MLGLPCLGRVDKSYSDCGLCSGATLSFLLKFSWLVMVVAQNSQNVTYRMKFRDTFFGGVVVRWFYLFIGYYTGLCS